MGIYRHTLIFKGPGYGSSESLYYEIPAPSSVAQAFTLLSDVKNKRRALLGKEWEVSGERIEQVVDDLGAKQKNVGQVVSLFLPGVAAQPASETNISLLTTFADSTQRFKKLFYMVGCPRSLFPNADAFDKDQTALPGQWWSSFGAWSTLLKTLGAGWYSAPTTQQSDIVGYVFDPLTGRTTYTLNNPITWPRLQTPASVNIEFPLSRSPLDGKQLVIPTSATSCYTAKPRPASPWAVVGKLSLKTPLLIKLNVTNQQGSLGSITAQRPVSRKRGRPLLVSRGRAPVVRRW